MVLRLFLNFKHILLQLVFYKYQLSLKILQAVMKLYLNNMLLTLLYTQISVLRALNLSHPVLDLSTSIDLSQGAVLNNSAYDPYGRIQASNYYISRVTAGGKLQIFDNAKKTLQYNIIHSQSYTNPEAARQWALPNDDSSTLGIVLNDFTCRIYNLGLNQSLIIEKNFTFNLVKVTGFQMTNGDTLVLGHDGSFTTICRYRKSLLYTEFDRVVTNFTVYTDSIKSCRMSSTEYRFAIWKGYCYFEVYHCNSARCNSIYFLNNTACEFDRQYNSSFGNDFPLAWNDACTKIMFQYKNFGLKIVTLTNPATEFNPITDIADLIGLLDFWFLDNYDQFMGAFFTNGNFLVYGIGKNLGRLQTIAIGYNYGTYNRLNKIFVYYKFLEPLFISYARCSDNTQDCFAGFTQTNSTNSTNTSNTTNTSTTNTTNLTMNMTNNVTNTTNLTMNMTNNVTNTTNSTFNTINQTINTINSTQFKTNTPESIPEPVFEAYQQIMSNVLQNEGLETTNSFPGGRKLFSPFLSFFANFDDLQLYVYHSMESNQVFSTILDVTQSLESEKWKLIPFSELWGFFGIDTEKIKTFFNYRLDYTSPRFKEVQNNSNGFFNNSLDLFFSNMFITLIIYCFFRLVFRLTFNYRASRLLRQYAFWPFYFIMFLEGNVQFLSYLYAYEMQNFFSFRLSQKLNLMGVVGVFFWLLIFCSGSFFIFKQYYQQLAKYFIDNVRLSMAGITYFSVLLGYKNILLGFFHSVLDNYQSMKLIALLATEILLMIFSIVLLSKRKCFQFKIRVWITQVASFIRILLIFTLFLENSFTSIENFVFEYPHLVLCSTFIFSFPISIIAELAFLVSELKQLFFVQEQQTQKQSNQLKMKKSSAEILFKSVSEANVLINTKKKEDLAKVQSSYNQIRNVYDPIIKQPLANSCVFKDVLKKRINLKKGNKRKIQLKAHLTPKKLKPKQVS